MSEREKDRTAAENMDAWSNTIGAPGPRFTSVGELSRPPGSTGSGKVGGGRTGGGGGGSGLLGELFEGAADYPVLRHIAAWGEKLAEAPGKGLTLLGIVVGVSALIALAGSAGTPLYGLFVLAGEFFELTVLGTGILVGAVLPRIFGVGLMLIAVLVGAAFRLAVIALILAALWAVIQAMGGV